MLKRSIGIGMLCFAGHAYSADIVVTTTEDVVKDDTECSLREAIEYLNMPTDKRPEAGYMGCGGKDATSNILLSKQKEYRVTSPLEIKSELLIRTDYTTDSGETVVAGMNNATIKMTGTSNLFVIDDQNDTNSVSVTFKEVNLVGCEGQKCASEGGIIRNNERLILNTVKLSGGWADKGGAIYNVGINVANPSYASTVEISNSVLENNKAVEGGAIYTGAPAFFIASSVFKNNETTNTNSANIYSSQALADEKISAFPLSVYKISNSTFLSNKGAVVNLVDGVGLNNLTMVANTNGVILNAPLAKAYVSNSILLGNPYPVVSTGHDCTFISGDKSQLWNNVVSPSCGSGNAIYPNSIWTGTNLIAGSSIEGSCESLSENKEALLCPYSKADNAFMGYFRPRILLSYNTIADSLIINRGRVANGTDPYIVCEGSDQRGESRNSDVTTCDRGSIEIIVPTSVSLAGQDILIGDVAKISIADYLGDSDLIPKEECQALLGDNPTGAAWQDGCVQVVQRQTPSKGSLTLDIFGHLVYTPNGPWRGADMFTIRVVTSSTRFNKNKPYMEININVVQEAENTLESKSVKTSGGAMGVFSLLSILGLVGLRRYKK